MAPERPPFYFLDNNINLLLVDDDPGVRSLISSVLEPVKTFLLRTASCAQDAEQMLKSPDRIHLCILDLGLNDINNDEFHLLKKYSAGISFVVFTGSASPERGFSAARFGARDIIEKSPSFDRILFFRKICRNALINIINPRYRKGGDTLSLSTEVLFGKSPRYVSQWAIQTGITDRELRHIWRKNLGANAKIILSIYQAFSAAFSYYEKTLASAGLRQARIQNPAAYRRLEEYYHIHRSTIFDFIAYGNVAALIQQD